MTENQEEIQQKFVLYQMLNQRIEEIKQHATLIHQKMVELETTRQGLEGLESLGKNSDTLVPVGSGCFVDGNIDKVEKVLVDLGAGVMTHKPLKEAMEFVESKKKEMEDGLEHLQAEANAIAEKMGELAPELQKIAEEQQNQAGEAS